MERVVEDVKEEASESPRARARGNDDGRREIKVGYALTAKKASRLLSAPFVERCAYVIESEREGME